MNPDPRTERAVDSASDAQIGRLLTDVANAPDSMEVRLSAAVEYLRAKLGPKCSVWACYESGYSQFSASQTVEIAYRVQLLGTGPMIAAFDTSLSVACDKALAEWRRSQMRNDIADRIEREVEAAMKAVDAEKGPEYINDAKVAGLSPVPHADSVYSSEVEGAMEDDEKPEKDTDPYHADNDPHWGENNPANSNFIGRK